VINHWFIMCSGTIQRWSHRPSQRYSPLARGSTCSSLFLYMVGSR